MMRNHSGSVMAAVVLVVAVCSSSAHAQTAAALSCSAQNVYNEKDPVQHGDAVERMHPLVSRARYAKLVEEQQWAVAVAGLGEDARGALAEAAVSLVDQQRFQRQVDTVVALLAHLPPSGDPALGGYVDTILVAGRFNPAHLDRNDYRIFFYAGAQDTIDVTQQDLKRSQALCWSAFSIDQVLARISRPLQAASIARLGRWTNSWTNYRTYGYTRQPLELLLFRGRATDTLPKPTQWLLAHLSLGVDIHGTTADSILSSNLSVVELFGFLRYRKDYTQYFGGSLVVAAGSERPVGYGAMLHFARSLRAGALYHPGGDRRKWSVVTSTDLYGLLDHSKKSVEEGLAFARGILVLPGRKP